jgi:uncharacterized membrane protein YfhO
MRRAILVILIILAISLAFFFPIFSGKIPFPGDLLVGYYAPYNTNSYFGYQPGGVPNKLQGPDVIRQLFPWKNFAIDSFKALQIPFWNPYNLSGNPLMANFQSGVFYPFNFLFFANFLTGWTLYIFLIPVLTSIFTYLYLRELKIGKIASIFGGIVFAFSSYMVVWMEYGNVGHTFLWLPLALLFTEKLIRNFSKKYSVLLIISLTLSFLAGYVQGYFYIILTLIFYYIFKSRSEKTFTINKFLLFLIIFLYPMLLSAFQLIPTLELFSLSARNNYGLSEIGKLLNPVWYTVTIIIPNFFGNPVSRNSWFYGTYIERVSYFGFIPFIFAIFAISNFKNKKEIIIFSAIFVISLALATNLFFTKFIYLLPLPVISTTVPTRILSLLVFSGSILAAFGLDSYMKNTGTGIVRIIKIFAVLLTLIWIGVIGLLKFSGNPIWTSNLLVAKNNLILPALFLIAFSALVIINKHKKGILHITILGIFILTLFDLFYFFQKITPFSPKEFVYPSTPVLEYLKKNASIFRMWGYGTAAIENNFQTYEKIFSPDGYEPLHIKSYGELISTSEKGTMSAQISRSDSNIVGGFGKTDLRDNRYRQQLLNLLGVKYVLSKNDSLGNVYAPDYVTYSQEIYKLIWQKTPWQIYENKKVLPRIFLASSYVVEKNKNKIIQMIFDKNFDLRNKIILEEDIVPKIYLSNDPNANVEIKSYASSKIVLQTNSKTDMLLFISDNYYPGWRVSIDNGNGKIYRADYSFRAVPIMKGNHQVVFSYNSEAFNLGVKVSLVALVSLIEFIIVLKLKRHGDS